MKTRAIALLLALGVSALAASGHTQQAGTGKPADEPLFRVRVRTADVAAVKARLVGAGYDVLAADAEQRTIDLAVTRDEWRGLENGGLQVTLVDRARPLQQALQAPVAAAADPAPEISVTAAALPASYRDLDAIVARMQAIATAYPAIAQLVDITSTYSTPPTVEGRHLYALKISDNVTVDEDEPAMLIVSAHHAREISTPVIALGAAERLTAGYANDARIAAAVNGHEIWIAPVWNPDGYNHVVDDRQLVEKEPSGLRPAALVSTRTATTRRAGADLAPAALASVQKPTRARRPRPKPKPRR